MEENKIQTAEEFFKKKGTLLTDTPTEGIYTNDTPLEYIIEFTKLHVKAALKAAAEKTSITYLTVCEDGTTIGVFKTQQEALDFANLSNKVTSLHHDWTMVTRLKGGMDKNSILSAYPESNIQ
jgi:hypothetical protein